MFYFLSIILTPVTIIATAMIKPISHQNSKFTSQLGSSSANSVCGITNEKTIHRPMRITTAPQKNFANGLRSPTTHSSSHLSS